MALPQQAERRSMKHLGSRTLETERLVMRAFVPEDTGAMFRNWASDPEVTKFLTWPTHQSEEVTAQVVASWVEQNDNPTFYQWAIVWKETMEPVGSISVVHWKEYISEAEVGYCIGRPWWHRGVMTECFSEVIRFLFLEVGANRITAQHDVNNPHSGMVMKKCGLLHEGIQRQTGINNQGICDMSVYGILRRDFEAKETGA